MSRAKPEAVARLSWAQVAAWRAARHHLDARVPRTHALAVVQRLCGLHAQLMSSAELTLWARVEGLRRESVSTWLWEDRSLVKTWAMRGTLHLLPASEFGMWTGALGNYDHFTKDFWLKAFGVTREELDGLIAAVGKSLKRRQHSRASLAEAVGTAVGSQELGEKLRSGWGSFLKPAAFSGLLCFGPSSGQNVTFVHPAKWLPRVDSMDPEEAMKAVTRRFLELNGPSTREELARWWGSTPPAAGRSIAALEDAVVPIDVEGKTAWMVEELVDEAIASEPSGTLRLLPAFDQYVVMSPRVDDVVSKERRPKVFRKSAWFSPVIVVDGRMLGIWKHERKGRRLVVGVEPFTRLSRVHRQAVLEELNGLAAFLGGDLEVVWS